MCKTALTTTKLNLRVKLWERVKDCYLTRCRSIFENQFGYILIQATIEATHWFGEGVWQSTKGSILVGFVNERFASWVYI